MADKTLTFDEHVKKYKLDDEEAELLRSFEAGEWESVPDLKKRKQELKEAVEYTWKLRKSANANFRIQLGELNRLKKRAAEKGIRYQTLLTTLVHQYLEGEIEVKL